LGKAVPYFSQLSDFKAACKTQQTQQLSNTHYKRLPYSLSRNIIQHSPWAYWVPSTPEQNEKHKQGIVI
jgi:hypothetical protein